MHCQLAGGGFGRRLFADFVAEAAEISKAIGQPVQLLWTRQDDMRHGYFQPATANWFKGGLDASGALVALQHKTQNAALTIYDMHQGRNIWTNPLTNREIDPDEPWGAYENPYEIRNLRVDCADATSPVPVGPWRAVEYPSTVFGRESFLDELAHAAGADPIAFRLALLPRNVKTVGEYTIDRGRLARVLEAVRDRSGWARPLPTSDGRRRGRGVAANVYHAGSYVAMVAEISVAADGSDLRVERIVATVDCGLALNPLGVEGQTESGIAWGLSATLLGQDRLQVWCGGAEHVSGLSRATDESDARARHPNPRQPRDARRLRRASGAAGCAGGRERGLRRHRQANPRAADHAGQDPRLSTALLLKQQRRKVAQVAAPDVPRVAAGNRQGRVLDAVAGEDICKQLVLRDEPRLVRRRRPATASRSCSLATASSSIAPNSASSADAVTSAPGDADRPAEGRDPLEQIEAAEADGQRLIAAHREPRDGALVGSRETR